MAVLHQIRTKVVGVTKKNECDERIQELLDSISDYAYDGMPLELEHEYDNEYDENAIKVYCDGDHIGYLSREMAETVVDAVDEGRVEAEIAEITGGDEKSYGCNIVIRILDTQAAPVAYTQRPKPELPSGLIDQAREYVKTTPTVNIAAIQRQFHVGYSTAAAVIDKLEELGDVGPFQGSQPRPVYTYEPSVAPSSVHIPEPRIKKLKENVLLFPLTVALAALFAFLSVTFFFVAHSIPYGIGTLIGAGLCALWSLQCSDAADQLEEMGEAETAAKAKKTGKKLAVLLLAFCFIFSAAYVGVSRYMDDKRAKDKAEAWDGLAISTAMVALDQYAPDVNYGPTQSKGWTVIHNGDSTTTVWVPKEYGRISLMMTDDGEAYTPYWISVNGTVVLDVGKP